MFKVFSFSFFLNCMLILSLVFVFGNGVSCSFYGFSTLLNSLFCFDAISFYFGVLVIFLGVYTQFNFMNFLSYNTKFFLFCSLLFSLLSFIINHCIIFWCVYELAMLPLLYLIFKESPYSERFLAGWYFASYLLVTSLPLILILLYLSFLNGSFYFSEWVGFDSNKWILILLSFVFFTKVPLVPFHTWLPIVHAEATSIVSIFLSGYIMKLGLLGVYRCCYYCFDSGMLYYLAFTLLLSISFLLTACTELDGKRWLAFLSLAHIVVPFLCYFVADWSLINYSFFYCLGHGVSAGLVFGLLWMLYDVCNSRNWILLKGSIGGSFIMYFTVISILSLCSFPTTIQFFCEVGMVSISYYSLIYEMFWCVYLFLGGLVPLVLLGHLLIRSEFTESVLFEGVNYFYVFIGLCIWCYLGVFLI